MEFEQVSAARDLSLSVMYQDVSRPNVLTGPLQSSSIVATSLSRFRNQVWAGWLPRRECQTMWMFFTLSGVFTGHFVTNIPVRS